MRNLFLIPILNLVILSCSTETNDNELELADFVQFRLFDDMGETDSQAMITEDTGEQLFLQREVLLNLNDVTRAEVKSLRGWNSYHVYLVLTRTSKWKLSEITGNKVGKRLGIFVDGELQGTPRINEQIDTGKIPIYFNVSASEAERLRDQINNILAALPKQEQTVTDDANLDSLYLTEKLNLEGHYLFQPVHVSEVIALEESLGSKRIETTGTLEILSGEKFDFEQLLEYDRPITGYVTPSVLYAFSKPDSVVRFVDYAFMVKLKNLKERELAGERYFRLDSGVYPRLKEIFISELGKPVREDILQEIKQNKEGSVQAKNSMWKKDSITLVLSLTESHSVSVSIWWD